MKAIFRFYLLQTFISLCFLNASAYSHSIAWYDRELPNNVKITSTSVCCKVWLYNETPPTNFWVEATRTRPTTANSTFTSNYDEFFHSGVCEEEFQGQPAVSSGSECKLNSRLWRQAATLLQHLGTPDRLR